MALYFAFWSGLVMAIGVAINQLIISRLHADIDVRKKHEEGVLKGKYVYPKERKSLHRRQVTLFICTICVTAAAAYCGMLKEQDRRLKADAEILSTKEGRDQAQKEAIEQKEAVKALKNDIVALKSQHEVETRKITTQAEHARKEAEIQIEGIKKYLDTGDKKILEEIAKLDPKREDPGGGWTRCRRGGRGRQ